MVTGHPHDANNMLKFVPLGKILVSALLLHQGNSSEFLFLYFNEVCFILVEKKNYLKK